MFDLTMASTIKHPLELRIVIEYFVERDQKNIMTYAAIQKAHAKDNGALRCEVFTTSQRTSRLILEERIGLPSIQLDTTIMHAFKFSSEFLELYKLHISSMVHWETTVANGLSDIV